MAFWLLPAVALAANFYVAPTGSDTNAGTLAAPFATISRAQSAASAGDTVYLRGGTYTLANAQITQTDSNYAYVNYLDKSGTAGHPISYVAYPGETPVFDFSQVRPDALRVCAFYVKGSYLNFQDFEIIGVQITIATVHTQSECIRVEGSNNTLTRLKMHDGMGIGIYIIRHAGGNLVENCDAHDNTGLDSGSIGNIDGFGCHVLAGAANNVFRGCRAWTNSDDGFDCINCAEPVLFDHCWSYNNGWQGGDGNGFKIGGWGSTPAASLPSPIPRHTVIFCLSAGNKAHGFYANHQPGGAAYWYNNTAYHNGDNFDLLERTSDNVTDISGISEILHNNVGLAARGSEVKDLNESGANVSNNYWTLAVSVSSADFQSTDVTQMTQARPADGSLPRITFMHLANASALRNQGLDVGLPYSGTAPDLGCFENPPVATPANLTASGGDATVALAWGSVAGATSYTVKRSTTSGGNYTTVSANLTGTSYTDATLANGVAYYYIVVASNYDGDSNPSLEASATPTQTFTQWISGYFPGSNDSAVIGPTADPNGNGVPNLLEYLSNTNPTVPGQAGAAPACAVDGNGNLVLDFRVAKNLNGVTYVVQQSPDLIDWTDVGVAPAVLSDQGSYYVMRAVLAYSPNVRLFLRLRVSMAGN
ncbi:MAG TPA: right-handed parallel beta-helix repeat-containing protein [Opitutales bacterium]|nr:right-handed parallel beta-helix repeat-containing protein [Opitutales bacterium]